MGGYKRDTMPNLARRAKDAALFTRSYTNSASTRQSFRSLLSGLLPSQVAPSRGKSKWALSFPKDQTTLAHYLSAAGAKTIAIQTNAVFLESGSRALAGFEVRDFTPAGAWKANRYSANYHVDRLIAHCSDFGEQQSRFVFSHMMEPHQPFRKGPGSKNYGKAPNDRYDSALRYVDTQLERVLSFALSPERRGNTYVIITSDHGMGVGDRNNLQQHGNSVYDDQVRVPLLIFGPKIKGRRIDTPVSLNDLFPTIVEMAGLPRLEHVCGQSLLAAAKGEAEPNADPVVVEIFPDHANPTFKLAMVIGDHKLVVDVRHDRRSLFDLKKDPKEGKDLVDTRPELLLELEEQLADWLRDRGRDPAGYGLIR
jgi:arylsulfatase A-like enzyme